jgi:hypothetical protein
MEWFSDLDWRIRMIIPGILLILNVALFFAGYFSVYLVVAFVVTLLFCGRSNAEKNGYKF